jgi:hypothetical protein
MRRGGEDPPKTIHSGSCADSIMLMMGSYMSPPGHINFESLFPEFLLPPTGRPSFLERRGAYLL